MLDQLRDGKSQLSDLILHVRHNDLGAVEDSRVLVSGIKGRGVGSNYVCIGALSIGTRLVGTVVPSREVIYCSIGVCASGVVRAMRDIAPVLRVPAMVLR